MRSVASRLVAAVLAAIAFSASTSGPAGAAPRYEPQITNGRNAEPGEYPFMIALVDAADDDNFQAHFCGASLIHAEWVLTAAHCVVDEDGVLAPSQVEAVVGAHDLTENDGTRVPVAEIVLHAGYNPATGLNDIALIRLATLQSSGTIAYADSGDASLETPGTEVTLTGWGGATTDQEDQEFPAVLQEAEMPVLAPGECTGDGFEDFDDASQVCAGEPGSAPDGGVDACQGDSGGPLFATSNGVRIQIGIVSYGPTCGMTPSAYTRVSAYVDFVAATIGGPEPEPVEEGLPDGAERIAGSNRYATAAALATSRWTGPVDRVYLVTGEAFPDALAIAPKATINDAPILLTTRDALPAETAAALRELAPVAVTIAGGPAAVSDAVAAEVQALTGGPLTRVAGPDRYATAAEIARLVEALPAARSSLFVASGESFADALGGAAAAGSGPSVPLLLVTRDALPPVTAEQITRLAPETVYVLGGTNAVSHEVVLAIDALGASVVRLAGVDRYDTAAAVATAAFDGAAEAVVATGAAFPDGLVGGALGAPVLLVPPPDDVPPSVKTAVGQLGVDVLAVLGGSGAVSDAQAREIGAAR